MLSLFYLSDETFDDDDYLREHVNEKIPHRNKSQVQVSLKVTAQIHHLNITVMLDFFFNV